jgi:hypothetical protein
MFEDIDLLDSLAPRDRAPVPDRRAAARYRCPPATPVRLSTAAAGRALAWGHDLSRKGVGILAEGPLAAGAGLDVELLGVRGGRLRLPARVAHATRRLDGTWLVGCTFLRPVSEEELEALFR